MNMMKTTCTIFKKFIITPIKKSFKWYFEQMSKEGNYVCMTGTFPIEYYKWMWEKEDRERNKQTDKK